MYKQFTQLMASWVSVLFWYIRHSWRGQINVFTHLLVCWLKRAHLRSLKSKLGQFGKLVRPQVSGLCRVNMSNTLVDLIMIRNRWVFFLTVRKTVEKIIRISFLPWLLDNWWCIKLMAVLVFSLYLGLFGLAAYWIYSKYLWVYLDQVWLSLSFWIGVINLQSQKFCTHENPYCWTPAPDSFNHSNPPFDYFMFGFLITADLITI